MTPFTTAITRGETSLWTNMAKRKPLVNGEFWNVDLSPQYKEWGAQEIFPFEADEMKHSTWNWALGSAMCRMPDGKWYWGHDSGGGGAYLSVRSENGFAAATGQEALARLILQGVKRSLELRINDVAEALERVKRAEQKLAEVLE